MEEEKIGGSERRKWARQSRYMSRRGSALPEVQAGQGRHREDDRGGSSKCMRLKYVSDALGQGPWPPTHPRGGHGTGLHNWPGLTATVEGTSGRGRAVRGEMKYRSAEVVRNPCIRPTARQPRVIFVQKRHAICEPLALRPFPSLGPGGKCLADMFGFT